MLSLVDDFGSPLLLTQPDTSQMNALVIMHLSSPDACPFALVNRVFHTQGLGNVAHLVISKYLDIHGHLAWRACIYVDMWYDTPQSVHFRETLTAVESEARIVYDDPHSWIVQLLPTQLGEIESCKFHKMKALRKLLHRVNPFLNLCQDSSSAPLDTTWGPTPTSVAATPITISVAANPEPITSTATTNPEPTNPEPMNYYDNPFQCGIDTDWDLLSAEIAESLTQYRMCEA